MPNDWYPTRLADRIPWHANFNTQAVLNGTTHGLTAGQVLQITADSTSVATVVNALEAADAFTQALTEWKDLILEGPLGTVLPPIVAPPSAVTLPVAALPSIAARTRQYAAIIKASVGYTPEIGEQYGIIPPVAPAPSTPALVATALTQSQVELRIAKGGYSVIAIDSRRGGGAWEQIGVSMTAEYIDGRPPTVAGQPEVREFRAQGMLNNVRVGALSAVASAVTVP